MLGVIADDLTGAMDAAGLARRRGVAVSVAFGMSPPAAGSAVHVCALKIRTVAAQRAVDEALAAARMLRAHGAGELFFKYCSTFDSTPQGNIGPVAMALADMAGAGQTVFVPSFPENGRTVYHGHLFVGDRLLSESSLATHPLTPMTDPDLVRVLAAQSPGLTVTNLPLAIVEQGAGAIRAWCKSQPASGLFIIADALADRHLATLGEAFGGSALNTGGSAFCGECVPPSSQAEPSYVRPVDDQRGAVLAGSCSQATRMQLARVGQLAQVRQLDPLALVTDADLPEKLAQEALAGSAPIVIASTAEPDQVAAARDAVGANVGERIEAALGQIALRLAAGGITRFVIAGGETSGAVADAFGATTFEVGEEIAPGVPWARMARDGRMYDFAFKSGNFGGPDFFLQALALQQEAA